MKSISVFFTGAAALLLFTGSAAAAAAASDWPHLRGPGLDGRAPAAAELGEEMGLALEWRVPLGPGYSGIAIADGTAITSFGTAESDVVGAFDLDSGREIWRHTLNPVTRGRDGSDDGPLSTPVIAGERVFVVGATGRLVALGLADDSVLWQKRLPDDFGSIEPHFGFTTTPLLADDKLIVMTGGSDDRAISALDPENGSTIWATGAEKVDYQIPIAIELAGRLQVVAVTGKTLLGLAPEDGEVLWTHEFGEEDWVESATATYAGENRFLVFASGDAAVFGVEKTDGSWSVRELYRSKTLGSSYALPVYRDGYLYGFRGQVLSCVDAESGERIWRSRPPGGRGLILAGDKLIVFGARGAVVVADASPEGYRERASLRALEASSYTWPAFADGRVVVRNLDELAAVELSSSGGASAPAKAAGKAEHEFGAWLAELVGSEDRNSAIAEYLVSHPHSPILEGRFAHFVFSGEAEDLVLTGSMLPTANAAEMERVEGTGFHYKTLEVEPGSRFEYRFVRDFSEQLPDPRNPNQVPSRFGPPMSQFVTAGYETPTHVAEPENRPRGRVEELSLESKETGKRELRIYLPPGYETGSTRYPLLLVHDGLDWLEKGLMANSLDNLIGASVRPVVVAFLKPRDEWWLEAGGTGTDEHAAMVVEELLPVLEERYRLAGGESSHAVMGHMGYGLASAYLALKHPELFGKVAIQSPQIGLGYEGAVRELLPSAAARNATIYLDWNRHEVRDLDGGFDLYEESRSFARALENNDIAFVGGEVNDSFGWAGWRARTDRILQTLFPLTD